MSERDQSVSMATNNFWAIMKSDQNLSESEYKLIAILIALTLDIDQPNRTFSGVDVRATSTALQCFGYSQYETPAMVWTTLREIGERCYV